MLLRVTVQGESRLQVCCRARETAPVVQGPRRRELVSKENEDERELNKPEMG